MACSRSAAFCSRFPQFEVNNPQQPAHVYTACRAASGAVLPIDNMYLGWPNADRVGKSFTPVPGVFLSFGLDFDHIPRAGAVPPLTRVPRPSGYGCGTLIGGHWCLLHHFRSPPTTPCAVGTPSGRTSGCASSSRSAGRCVRACAMPYHNAMP